MMEEKEVNLSGIIGSKGKYQVVLYLTGFYSWWFIGTAVVTVELLAPMVTLYWDWNADQPNRTTFSSTDCKMDKILELNRTSNLSNWNSKLIYVSQYSRRTLTEDLDMVCERSWLVSFANFMCMIGLCLGTVMLPLSEKYGRRPLIILAAFVSVAVSLCMSFTVNYVMLAVCSLLFRASTNQTIVLLFIQTMEIAPMNSVPYIGLFSKSGLLFGQAILTGGAWVLRNWFHTQLFQTALILGLPLLCWYVLESPAWLAVRGRYAEAREVLVTIVKRNGRRLEDETPKIDLWLQRMKVRCEEETTAEKGKIRDLFRNKRITLYTCGATFFLASQGFIYMGLTMNTESFGSGMYMDLLLSNTLSMGSVFIAALLLQKISIRVLLIWFSALVGLSCIAYPTSYDIPLARSIIGILGRMFISPVIAVAGVYLNQIFPTSVRGIAIAFTSLVSFLCSSTSPFTKELAEKTSVFVPFILFALLSLITSVIYKLLPETKGVEIIHTVEEMKIFSSSNDDKAVTVPLTTNNSKTNTV